MVETAEKKTYTQSVTPSGIEVFYQWEPKRLYRLRSPKRPDGSHNYDWLEAPSVTQVLDVLDKPGLPWWGMKVGVEGVLTLTDMHLLTSPQGRLIINTSEGWQKATTDQVVDLLTKTKLTVNHVKEKAGRRGLAVHEALEAWARLEQWPEIESHLPEERGYVTGLCKFLDSVPSARPIAAEVMIGSLEHKFAGRYDVRFETTEPHAVVVHRTPKKGPQYARLEPGIYLADLKTSKGVYDSHSLQLEGYEGASIESGYEPTQGRGILNVSPDGTYKFVRSTATFQDFLNVRAVYQSFEDMKERRAA